MVGLVFGGACSRIFSNAGTISDFCKKIIFGPFAFHSGFLLKICNLIVKHCFLLGFFQQTYQNSCCRLVPPGPPSAHLGRWAFFGHFLVALAGAPKWSAGKRRNTQKQTLFCCFSRGGLQHKIHHLGAKASVTAVGLLFSQPSRRQMWWKNVIFLHFIRVFSWKFAAWL